MPLVSKGHDRTRACSPGIWARTQGPPAGLEWSECLGSSCHLLEPARTPAHTHPLPGSPGHPRAGRPQLLSRARMQSDGSQFPITILVHGNSSAQTFLPRRSALIPISERNKALWAPLRPPLSKGSRGLQQSSQQGSEGCWQDIRSQMHTDSASKESGLPGGSRGRKCAFFKWLK